MKHRTCVSAPTPARMAAASGHSGRPHRDRRPGPPDGGMQQRPVVGLLRGSPNAGGSADSRIGIDYTSCIRSRGVPDYPDPDSSGALPKGSAQDFGASSPSSRRPSKPARTRCATMGRLRSNARRPGTVPGRGAARAERHAEIRARAPMGCRTGPTRPSIPRAVLSSMSAMPWASLTSTRTRRCSSPRIANASAW